MTQDNPISYYASPSSDLASHNAPANRYAVVRNLGRGSFGEVFQATDKATGEAVALKRIFLSNPEQGMPANVMREYKALQVLESPYVIRQIDVFPSGPYVVNVLELCATDLYTVLRGALAPLPPAVSKRMMRDLLRAVRDVHAAGIIHRDIKPSNVMLTATGALKLTDFGLCRPVLPQEARGGSRDDGSGGVAGDGVPLGGRRAYSMTMPSQSYRAPELLFNCKTYDGFAVDMWSVGCVCAELIRNAPLFKAEGELQQLACIMDVLGEYRPEGWGAEAELPDYGSVQFTAPQPRSLAVVLAGASPAALRLVQRMLSYNPAERPSAEEALVDQLFFQEPLPCSDAYMHEFLESLDISRHI